MARFRSSWSFSVFSLRSAQPENPMAVATAITAREGWRQFIGQHVLRNPLFPWRVRLKRPSDCPYQRLQLPSDPAGVMIPCDVMWRSVTIAMAVAGVVLLGTLYAIGDWGACCGPGLVKPITGDSTW